MHLPWVAVAVALLSVTCYAVAAVLQQLEAIRQSAVGLELVARLIRRPRWWLAVASTVTGALLHVVALRFGPLTLVQPLGVSALVLALPLGAWMAGRAVSRNEWAAAVAVVLGLLAILTLAPHHAPPPLVTVPELLGATGGAAAIVLVAVAVSGRMSSWFAPVLRAGSAAICFGFASAMARLLVAGSGPLWLAAILCGGMAVVGFALVQTAYRNGGLGAPLATCTLVDPLSAATIGIVLLGERVPLTPVHVLLGVVGLGLTGVGLTILARTAHQVPAAIAEPVLLVTGPEPAGQDLAYQAKKSRLDGEK